jgi:AcrR family transcriptional regulator
MTDTEKNTESAILDAAKKIFISKGFSGARMQEIADEAGINKALLHYYFRSKDKLFDAIFEEAFRQFMPRVSELMNSDRPLNEKIWGFVESYTDMLLAHPHVPIFVMHELHLNPERLISHINNSGLQPRIFMEQLNAEVAAGRIRPIHPAQLIVNMISMCIFPFAGRPIITHVLFQGDEEAYLRFLQERKTEVTLFIMNALKPN